jgi:hypothetical protein
VQNTHGAGSVSPHHIEVYFPGPADGPSQLKQFDKEESEWRRWKVLQKLGVRFQHQNQFMNWLRESNGERGSLKRALPDGVAEGRRVICSGVEKERQGSV